MASPLMGCSPTCLLLVKVVSPSGIQLDGARLFVTGAKACPPAPVTAPTPSPEPLDAEHVRQSSVAGGIDLAIAFRGRHCRVQASIWYDTDGSGAVDAGDWVGSTPAIDVKDGGLLGDNFARSSDVHLARRL